MRERTYQSTSRKGLENVNGLTNDTNEEVGEDKEIGLAIYSTRKRWQATLNSCTYLTSLINVMITLRMITLEFTLVYNSLIG